MDDETLLQVDATSRFARDTNMGRGGRWWSLGCETFRGMELHAEGIFDEGIDRDKALVDKTWKARYSRFGAELRSFAAPFSNPLITTVGSDDEVAYFRCVLRTDLVDPTDAGRGVYIEVDIKSNPDNFSLAVVDFDEGGASSLTFSPDTGAVINERKVCESPRRVQGMYIQPLGAIAANARFRGQVGLYLAQGRLAFFRRCCPEGDDAECGPWESTGFVTDVSWAEGQRLTPCIAFRGAGDYHLQTTRVDRVPPFVPNVLGKDAEHEWSSLDWEAPQADA